MEENGTYSWTPPKSNNPKPPVNGKRIRNMILAVVLVLVLILPITYLSNRKKA